MRWISSSLLLLGFLAGCSNPCQDVCDEMADYAEECGLTVTSDDVKQCKEDFARSELEKEDLDHCKEWNSGDALREWWSCDDVAENFQSGQ